MRESLRKLSLEEDEERVAGRKGGSTAVYNRHLQPSSGDRLPPFMDSLHNVPHPCSSESTF